MGKPANPQIRTSLYGYTPKSTVARHNLQVFASSLATGFLQTVFYAWRGVERSVSISMIWGVFRSSCCTPMLSASHVAQRQVVFFEFCLVRTLWTVVCGCPSRGPPCEYPQAFTCGETNNQTFSQNFSGLAKN